MRSCDLSVNHKLNGPDLSKELISVCNSLIDTWKDDRFDDIEVSTISGGISNALYKISIKHESLVPRSIVLRVYGDNTEKFIDRDEEVKTMSTLHSHGFGPRVVGTFRNGRIESFLELSCLKPDDISKEMFKYDIARTLAKFHLISKAWEAPKTLPTPFERTKEWLHTAKPLDFSDNERQLKLFESIDVDAVLREVDFLSDVAHKLDSPAVFAHNDLLSGNIMVDVTHGQVNQMTFIDFEYADWAPRGFDLGNHFCEYAGFDGDYSRYPEQSDDFVKAYLETYHAGTVPTKEEISRVVKEANVYCLASHLYWAAWAILQAKWSSIDFDYMEYATVRLSEYYKRKDGFIDACNK